MAINARKIEKIKQTTRKIRLEVFPFADGVFPGALFSDFSFFGAAIFFSACFFLGESEEDTGNASLCSVAEGQEVETR